MADFRLCGAVRRSTTLALIMALLALVAPGWGFVAPRLPSPRYASRLQMMAPASDGKAQAIMTEMLMPDSTTRTTRTSSRETERAAPSPTTPALVQLNLLHFPQIFSLTFAEFKQFCRTQADHDGLRAQIFRLFLPKLVLPWITGNSLLGLDLEGSLVGFVDVSLQPQSMAALEWTPLAKRKALHGDALRPYLCNLLVDPRHRKRGYGKRLVRACLDTSRDWGYVGELFLHVEPSDRPAVTLYNSLGFTAVKNEQHTTLMTRKKTA